MERCDLRLESERRVLRRVVAASRLQMDRWGHKRFVLALDNEGILFWIALERDVCLGPLQRVRLGELVAWRGPLGPELGAHTRQVGWGRQAIEISRPYAQAGDRLYRGELYGPQADEFVGMLAQAQFSLRC